MLDEVTYDLKIESNAHQIPSPEHVTDDGIDAAIDLSNAVMTALDDLLMEMANDKNLPKAVRDRLSDKAEVEKGKARKASEDLKTKKRNSELIVTLKPK